MTVDWQRSCLVAVALVLLANPLLLPNLTEPTYTYRAAPLTVTEDGIDTPETAVDGDTLDVPRVDCDGGVGSVKHGSTLCILDVRALERGSVNLSVDPGVVTNSDGFLNEWQAPTPESGSTVGPFSVHSRRYTRLDGQYYERVYTPANGTYRLLPVTPRQVVENVSVPYERGTLGEIGPVDPQPYRQRVVDRGRLTLHGPHISETIVERRTGDGVAYYLVWQSDVREPIVDERTDRRLVIFGRWLLFALGVALLLRQW
ncbi:hypothetical protein ACAH01_12160 [Halomicrobium sp. HM KBTZ05]|uniref:hypothetical protein n=1 Tax=Halomicrobium sp. HM KBTZ05 TaxID=3242663 RepID=UPI003556D88C